MARRRQKATAKVTPKMVEAGLNAFLDGFGGGRLVLQDAVTKVYLAMRAAAGEVNARGDAAS